ncbi:MAG: APH(3') family aminoglycoside O-phosphotransferase [Clostridiales bacterium]|nr:APH(3') family aminoglycoside O-phosphotransferase [Clostridiales bacterium]
MKILDIIGENYFGKWTSTRTGCRAVIIKDEKILMSYETKTGQWMLPGGGLEENESCEECVIREVSEECGVLIRPSSCVLEIDEYYEDCKWLNLYFFGEVTGITEKALTDREIEVGMEPRWMPISEIFLTFSKHQDYDGTDEMRRGMYLREYMALQELLIDRLPETIREKVSGQSFSLDITGKSGSTVMIFPDLVLKVMPLGMEEKETVQMTRWLSGKVPVPQILAFEEDEEKQYLLMSKVKGTMSCDKYYLEHPDEMVTVLANTLKLLWSIDISDCPRDCGLEQELQKAKRQVEEHLYDLEDAEPDTFGEGGFRDPEDLLQWLFDHKPSYEPVLSHGDYCLPNVLIEDGKLSGLIDMGNSGIADKWEDIAMCYRSLKHNMNGTYGGKAYPDFRPEVLFEKLGIEPNWEKIRYYILLDELF